MTLLANRDVDDDPLVNLTRRGKRRTVVMVGVDYRADHDDALGALSMGSSNTRSWTCC